MIIETTPLSSKPPGYSLPAGSAGRTGEGTTPSNRIIERNGSSDSPASTVGCPFGMVISIPDTSDKGIQGGIVHCGDQNFEVPTYEIALGADTVLKVYLELVCESNRDDDNEILLPGIATSSETDPSTFWQTTAGAYPANTSPGVTTGLGTIIIPLGILTVEGGVASFAATACGNVTVGQCVGTLSYSR
jgi:hypothetical protein